MKKVLSGILNFIKGTIISIWVLVAIFTTICLINYNDYQVSVFGDYSLFVVDNKSLEPTFHKNDIVIIKKGEEKDYNKGDQVFFYLGNHETNSYINLGQISDKKEIAGYPDEYVFGDTTVLYDKVIGAANGAHVYPKAGMVLNILESRWGFMFLIILPTLFAIVYELYYIAIEVKKESKKALKEEE